MFHSHHFYIYSSIKQQCMSDINNSLIGFLKKKSLFSESPDKNSRRKSRSKDKLQLNRSVRNEGSKQYLQTPRSQFQGQREEEENTNFVSYQNQDKKQNKNQDSYRKEKVHRNFKKTEEKGRGEEEVRKQVRSITSTNPSSSFESARLQSAQCLQNLSTKIRNQISNINYKVDKFEKTMKELLENQLKTIHQTITQVINQIFEQNYRNVKNYIRRQEESLGKDLFMMKKKLQEEYNKVEQMKDQINKPNWRKVAGQLLSSDLQANVDQIVARTNKIQMKQPRIFNYNEKQLKDFERSLKNLMKDNSQSQP